MKLKDIRRFLKGIDAATTNAKGCWLWSKIIPALGYSYFRWDNKNGNLHRFSYELFVDSIPTGMVIDHLCRVRHCFNPKHLEVVTIGENVLRGVSLIAENARKKYCLRGHALFGTNLAIEKLKNGKSGRRCRKCANDLRRLHYKERKR